MGERRKPKHSVIFCHPAATSFTQSVADRYCLAARQCGHEVITRNLYGMNFDPVLKDGERPSSHPYVLAPDVEHELELLSGTDVFVLVYPIWFGMPPAMLKGYVDRVLGAGFPHRAVRERTTHPLMSGKDLVSFTSSGTSRQWLDEQGAFQSLRKVFDTYLCHAFSLASAQRVHFPNIVEGTKKGYVEQCLFDVEQEARKACAKLVYHATTYNA
jgi:NAD(P)H dehydrogenase (quinone)